MRKSVPFLFMLLLSSLILTAGQKFKTSAVLAASEARLIADYGSFRVYESLTDDLYASTLTSLAGFEALHMDTLKIDHFPINVMDPNQAAPEALTWNLSNTRHGSLQLIQFPAPIKDVWLDQIRATGAIPIHYIADNGYLVWADPSAQSALAHLKEREGLLQYHAPYQAHYKLGTNLLKRFNEGLREPDELVKVTVQMIRHDKSSESEMTLDQLIQERFTEWTPILKYQNVVVTLKARDIPTVATLADVYWIGEYLKPERQDEVQAQIMAGHLDPNQTGPSGTGYLDWLMERGLSDDPMDYPILDVVDDGLGNGTIITGDTTLHRYGLESEASRVAYVENCTSQSHGGGVDGHGHINASIAVGFDDRTGFPYQDGDGYRRGLGINPFGRVASTRIFGNSFDLSACGGTHSGLIQATYRSGAQISTNSWGRTSRYFVPYDAGSQAYDVGIRDADPETPGNQQLPHFFSAGNAGPGPESIGSPGNGKNTITIGASENDRPTWSDGCSIGPMSANNAMEIASFSSRGPASGGRVKPELIAPGTHIQGTASTYSSYTGDAVCDEYHPRDQSLFASSSGTSHSTPAVAGFGTLIYYALQNLLPVDHLQAEYQPTPSMMKAYLIAHAGTYLTGLDALENLPSQHQGYGMPHLGQALELETSRLLIDETVTMDNTGETFTWQGRVIDPAKPTKIVLAYTDAAGAIGTSPQVNNLDLEVLVDGETYYGNYFDGPFSTPGGIRDRTNNYEAIFLPAGIGDHLEIRVIGANIGGDGVPNTGDETDQDFSLVAYNVGAKPDFLLTPELRESSLCAPETLNFTVSLSAILDFDESVTLNLTDLPDGLAASIEPVVLTAPATANITIANTEAVTPGNYVLSLKGISTTGTQSVPLKLNISDRGPQAVAAIAPANGSENNSLNPVLEWEADLQTANYTVELSDKADFSNVIFRAETSQPSVQVNDLQFEHRYFWRIKGHNGCGESTYGNAFKFVTKAQPTDFMEDFGREVFDLENKTLTWYPQNSDNSYALCVEDSPAVFKHDPSDDTVLTFGSSATYQEITLSDGKGIPLYGSVYDTIYLTNYGSLMLGEATSTFNWSSTYIYFRVPRISATYSNYGSSGTISYQQLEDRFIVTYNAVRSPNRTEDSAFQVTMFFDGQIEITYLDMDVSSSFTGLSRGKGIPDNFQENDFSEMACGLSATSDAFCVGSDFSFEVRTKAPLTGWVTLSAEDLPDGVGVTISPNPVKLGETARVTLQNTGVYTSGDQTFRILGDNGEALYEKWVNFVTYTEGSAPTLGTPEHGDQEQAALPEFSWSGGDQTSRYVLEIAIDEAFENVLLSVETAETTYQLQQPLDSYRTYYWRVTGSNLCGSLPSEVRSFKTAEVGNYFSEHFLGDIDLEYSVLSFEPVGTLDYYSLCTEPITQLPYDPTVGTEIILPDDNYEAVSLNEMGGFNLYGTHYETAYICSNGYITLGIEDRSSRNTFESHFSDPRIAAFFDDINPDAGGEIRYAFYDNAFVVTWLDVPEYGLNNRSTAQIILYSDGRIEIAYLGIDATDAIVGLSSGAGLPEDFQPSDLSSGWACFCPGDLNRDRMVDDADLDQAVDTWRATSTAQDVDRDGIMDVLDLVLIMELEGSCDGE